MASNHNVLSVGELQEWLNKKADIEEVKLTDFSDAFAKMLNYNALNCLLNNGAITDSSQLKFHLYHLRNTDQNAPYYNIPAPQALPRYMWFLNRKQVIWFLIVLNSSGNLPSQEE